MSMQISAQRVKELRNKTGAGMMDCKKALQASHNNMDIAIINLRKKGLTSADKKSSRITTEGIIESYIHTGSRVGVLLELNCETDFVARRSEFQKLAKDIAMQIAACPQVLYISLNDIPISFIEQETKIESDKEDLVNKAQNVKQKIIQGRIDKRIQEISLLDQSFIRDSSLSIKELIKQHIALLGENIKIKRFARFVLGETLEKKISNLHKEISNIVDQ